MKPSPFDFVRAESLAEATRFIAEAQGTARLIAGGQSLGPMLNLRLVRPRLLIDITGIPEMTRIEETDNAITLGACITIANIEDGKVPCRGLGMLQAVAAQIAYRAVRNRGTIGGSLCHADPASDLISSLCALDAKCLMSSPSGKRELPADQFIVGAYETALGPAEVLEAIKIPRLSVNGRYGYYKVCRKTGEFASAIAAVVNDREHKKLRIVMGATKGRPIVITNAFHLQRSNMTIDEVAVQLLLDQHGVVDRVARRQQIAALTRAYDQANKL